VSSIVAAREDDLGRPSTRWWPVRWTSPLSEERPQRISLFDLAELRGVVDTNRIAAGLDPIRWVGRTDNDPTFAAGATPVRAIHFTQLRDAIADLWDVGGLGALPEFRAGPILPRTRHVSIRDPLDLRGWVDAYEAARPDLAARVVWRYGVAPAPWPLLGTPLPDAIAVEMWDATGHSIFWRDSESTTELRRIDTSWYSTALAQAEGCASLTIAPVLATNANDDVAFPVALSTPSIDEHAGVPIHVWEPDIPDLESGWDVERDGLGRVVRILEGDTAIARLAYDGLGRLRKIVDATTRHVLGPGLLVAPNGGVGDA
jgi:YD repeat-containing protein